MGGLAPLRTIVASLPASARASVFVVVHIGANTSNLPAILRSSTALPVWLAADGEAFRAGNVYVAPPDRHLLIDEIGMHVVDGPRVHNSRPAIDPLFISAAGAFGLCVMGIVLSGGAHSIYLAAQPLWTNARYGRLQDKLSPTPPYKVLV